MAHDIFFDEQSHTYLVDGQEVPSVTEILKPLHRSYGAVNPSVLEQASVRGKAVHEACEDIDYDLEPEIPFEIEGYVRAYLDYKDLYLPEWEMVEQIVFCEEGWFIGTLDRMGVIDGKPCIVDLKTSTPNRESYLSVCLQTVAYAMAVSSETHFDPDWKDYDRYGLFLMKDGKYRLINCKEWEGQNHFNSADAFGVLLKTHKMITRLLATGKGKNDE